MPKPMACLWVCKYTINKHFTAYFRPLHRPVCRPIIHLKVLGRLTGVELNPNRSSGICRRQHYLPTEYDMLQYINAAIMSLEYLYSIE